MTNLLRSELRRALSRRIVVLFAFAAVLGIGISAITVSVRSEKPTTSLEEAQREYEALVQRCVNGELEIPPEYGPGIGQFPTSELEDFCRYSGFLPIPEQRAFRYASMDGVVLGTAVPLIIASFLLAASLIGAEWRAGTITTMLTWESNRLRLFLAKLGVAIIVCVGFALAVHLFLLLVMLPVAALRGSMTGVDAAFFGDVASTLGRSSLMVAVAASIGFGIGATGRNTAAALGVGFVYVAVIEGFMTGLLPWFRPWSLVGNAVVWVSGEGSREIAGRSVAAAGFLLTAYAAGVAALATSIFRARDVT